jgi:hypothetical protein
MSLEQQIGHVVERDSDPIRELSCTTRVQLTGPSFPDLGGVRGFALSGLLCSARQLI